MVHCFALLQLISKGHSFKSVLLKIFSSSFADYNKEQFTPTRLEGAEEQVTQIMHRVCSQACMIFRHHIGNLFGNLCKKVIW